MYSVLGWAGVVSILIAYAGVSFNIISASEPYFQLLNVFGAVGIIVSSLPKRNYQPVVLNAVWALIAVTALIKSLSV